MRFDRECIEELLSKVDILSLIEDYTSVNHSGTGYMALCPFHREKTPSMCVYIKTNSFYCFGCGVGGNAITFLMKIDNISYQDAVISLSERFGVPIRSHSGDDDSLKRKTIYSINRKCARLYFNNLFSEGGRIALDYLTKRGLTLNTIKRFGLGFSFADGISLFNSLKESFSESDLISSNVIVRYKNSIHDRFINRVMFPVIDVNGNVIAFGARSIDNKTPKYLNTSDTPVFKKSRNLFALNLVKQHDYAILTEGYMDAMSLHQMGFGCAISSLGTALSSYQAKVISRNFNEVYICYDSDDAGKKATDRASELLNNAGAKVRVISLSDSKAKDPDEFCRIYGDKANAKFSKLIESSLGYIDYKINRIKISLNLQDTDDKIKFLKKCSEFLSKIEDPVERDVYSSRICMKYGVSKNAFDLQINKCVNKRSNFGDTQNNKLRSVLEDSSDVEEFLISSVIASGKFPNFLSNLSSKNFRSRICFNIFEKIVELSSSNIPIKFNSISARLGDDVLGSFARIANLRGSEAILEDDIKKAYEILINEGKFRKFKSETYFENDDVMNFLDKLKENKK